MTRGGGRAFPGVKGRWDRVERKSNCEEEEERAAEGGGAVWDEGEGRLGERDVG